MGPSKPLLKSLRIGTAISMIAFGSGALSGCLAEAAVYVIAIPIAAVADAAGSAVQGSINETRREQAIEAKAEGERIFQSEILEARVNDGATAVNTKPVAVGSASTSWASEDALDVNAVREDSRPPEQLTIALLPADGWSLAGSSSSAATEERIHGFARKMVKDRGLSLVDRSREDSYYRGELWTGGSVNKKLNMVYAVSEGQRLGADGVLTFSYVLRGNKGGYNADIEVVLVDVETDRVYGESGNSKVLKVNTERALRYFEEEHRVLAASSPRRQPEESLKVGILPPGFLNPTLPSNAGKEAAVLDEIRRYVRASPSLELSYDYAARGGVGPIDAHAVWEGPITKKAPNIDTVRSIGEMLAVDVLVLAWIAGNTTNPIVDLYVVELTASEMSKGTGSLGQTRELIESTFAFSREAE